MANCNNLFKEFNGVIRLTDSRKSGLKTSRRDLRRKIRKFFDEEKPNEVKPKFSGQGSFMMDTIINPIPRKKEENGKETSIVEYDVDDGVYFIDSEDNKKTITTYHNWIYDAVDGHTNTPPKDKNTCVRVVFADGHHIDLPIYFLVENGTPELAHKRDGWITSDPREFTEWFNNKAKENSQLRRIVRCLKAWKDYREFSRTDKSFPSGLILTILAANNFYSHERDDISLKETLVLIESELNRSFSCYRPTTPAGEDLLEGYNNKDYFLSELKKFITDAKRALEEKNQKESCKYWQNHFGDRFPCHLAKDSIEEDKSAGLAGLGAASRPYGL